MKASRRESTFALDSSFPSLFKFPNFKHQHFRKTLGNILNFGRGFVSPNDDLLVQREAVRVGIAYDFQERNELRRAGIAHALPCRAHLKPIRSLRGKPIDHKSIKE